MAWYLWWEVLVYLCVISVLLWSDIYRFQHTVYVSLTFLWFLSFWDDACLKYGAWRELIQCSRMHCDTFRLNIQCQAHTLQQGCVCVWMSIRVVLLLRLAWRPDWNIKPIWCYKGNKLIKNVFSVILPTNDPSDTGQELFVWKHVDWSLWLRLQKPRVETGNALDGNNILCILSTSAAERWKAHLENKVSKQYGTWVEIV